MKCLKGLNLATCVLFSAFACNVLAYDQIFHDRFNIDIDVVYLVDNEVAKKNEPLFLEKWVESKKRYEMSVSKEQLEQIEASIKKIPLERPRLFLENWVEYKRQYERFSKEQLKQLEVHFKKIQTGPGDEEYSSRVEIKFISDRVGYGVFAKEDIPPDILLGHYAGVILLKEEMTSPDYLFKLPSMEPLCLDGHKKGNWTRFMNHAEVEKANVYCVHYLTERAPYVVFFTDKKWIKKGEQFLFPYGKGYWKNREFLDLTKSENER